MPIIDCDKLGHQMYKKEGPCYEKVVDVFGVQVLDQNGEIDRKILGNLVFKNPVSKICFIYVLMYYGDVHTR